MPRPTWSGSITFGLVTVPVKLYSAVRSREVRFHQLHDADGVRIQQKRVCPADGEEVSYDHVVRGYEVSKGQYVVVSDEELEALDPKGGRSIDIETFVDESGIDPLHYDHSYYLTPDRGAQKPYYLLLEAMKAARKVGIARVVMRAKQYLAAVRPLGNALALVTMNHPDEILPVSELEELRGTPPRARPKELEMAQQLIAALAGPFEPEQYHDEHRERVLELLKKKAEGEEVVVQPHVEEPTKVKDLMAALQESLRTAKKSEKPRRKRRAA
jgi:DNA end-binding protein Ku